MEKQKNCQQIIERNVPRLVSLLLNSEEEEGNKHAKYDECVNYGLQVLTNCKRPPLNPNWVLRNIDDFLERFEFENLKELGETVKILSQVIVDDQHCQEDFKYSILQFMLSVNYKAFSTANHRIGDTMARRSKVMEALADAYKQQDEEKKKSLKKYDPKLTKQSQKLDSEASSKSLVSESTQASDKKIKQQVVLEYDENQDDSQSFLLAIKAAKQQQQFNQDNDFLTSLHLNIPRRFGHFAESFANYLLGPLKDVRQAMLRFGEEGYLVRELLAMFFQPCDCHYFVVVNHLIQLRPNTYAFDQQQLMQQFLKPLQYMQLLRLHFDYYDQNQTKTMKCLKAAFRRILKPVVESLTFFELLVASGKGKATLSCLLHAIKHGFQRLQLLWNLVTVRNVLQTQQPQVAAHFRSYHIISNLLRMTKLEKDSLRGSAAALLLYALRVLCEYLDSWWQFGSFLDAYNEFPATTVVVNGRTEYKMRILKEGETYLENCPLYLIISKHIRSARLSLSALYNSKLLHHFVKRHATLLDNSLHNYLVLNFLQLLKPYQRKSEKNPFTAPDISMQLKSIKDIALRSIYHAYYNESQLGFSRTVTCGLEDLMKQCLSCASYTPFHDLICLSFERILESRVLLVNEYVFHRLRVKMQLDKELAYLRSEYLLFNFPLMGEQYEAALQQLQLGLIKAGTKQLQHLINSHNPRRKHSFSVTSSGSELDQIFLLYKCDPVLVCIISDSQLEFYNAAFRHLLQLHVAVRKLQQLPELPCDSAKVASLLTLKTALLLTFEQHLRTDRLQQAADQCDIELQRCESVLQLQQVHYTFVERVSVIIRENHSANLNDLIKLSTILEKHWLRLQRILTESKKPCTLVDFDVQYDKLNNQYLLDINRLSESMQCLLAWPQTNYQ